MKTSIVKEEIYFKIKTLTSIVMSGNVKVELIITEGDLFVATSLNKESERKLAEFLKEVRPNDLTELI